jgi:alkanesulfonate monooxygenase SsuD/methylene tetrahydromethanopterin reductase-like flavin-dependent oxidoreductase (luciferase family)
MEFGFSPPVSGPLSTPDSLARIAVEGEAIGYDYATISDHVVIPRDIDAKYPYSDTGEFPGRARGDRHEQLTTIAFVAGKTSRLRLVTSVTVVRTARRYCSPRCWRRSTCCRKAGWSSASVPGG